jgi:hypothetical protein
MITLLSDDFRSTCDHPMGSLIYRTGIWLTTDPPRFLSNTTTSTISTTTSPPSQTPPVHTTLTPHTPNPTITGAAASAAKAPPTDHTRRNHTRTNNDRCCSSRRRLLSALCQQRTLQHYRCLKAGMATLPLKSQPKPRQDSWIMTARSTPKRSKKKPPYTYYKYLPMQLEIQKKLQLPPKENTMPAPLGSTLRIGTTHCKTKECPSNPTFEPDPK